MRPRGSLVILKPENLSSRDQQQIEAIAVGTDEPLMVDLRNFAHVNSATFAWLVRLQKNLVRQGTDMVLTGLSTEARSLHEILKLERILPVAESPQDWDRR